MKLNNDNLSEKIKFRKKYATGKDVVFDLFAGQNQIWSQIETSEYHGYDIRYRGNGNTVADSYRVAPHIDFSRATIIDVDTYGRPWKMLDILGKNETVPIGCRFFLTCIAFQKSKANEDTKVLKEARLLFRKNAIIETILLEHILRDWTTTYEEYEIHQTAMRKRYLTFIKEK